MLSDIFSDEKAAEKSYQRK